MSTEVFLAASAARIARFLTSLATTAKPAPASPARAASTAALRARRLVWKAISSIVLMILEVSSLAFEISSMDWVSSVMEPLARSTICFDSFMRLSAVDALSAFCLVIDDISSSDEEVSSIEAACSEAPSASDWLAEETWPEADTTAFGGLGEAGDRTVDRSRDGARNQDARTPWKPTRHTIERADRHSEFLTGNLDRLLADEEHADDLPRGSFRASKPWCILSRGSC